MAFVSGANGGGNSSKKSLWSELGGSSWVNQPMQPSVTTPLQQAIRESSGITSKPTSSQVGVSSSSGSSSAVTPPVGVPVSVVTPNAPRPSGGTGVSANVPVGLANSPGQLASYEPAEVSVDEAVASGALMPSINTRDAGLDAWERMAAEREGRPVRTTNVLGEEYDRGDRDASWFDNQLNLVGNTPQNDAYMRDLLDQYTKDYSYTNIHDPDMRGDVMDDIYAIMHRPQSIQEEDEMRAAHPNIRSDMYDSATTDLIDDGTGTYGHMTADLMTGKQYRHYKEDLGMGGRDKINPTQYYSKRKEAVDYGFTPFTPDMSTWRRMVAQNLLDVPGEIGSTVGRLREAITPDYQISYNENGDGERRTISGRGFDKDASAVLNSFYYDRQFDPERFLSAPTDGSAYSTLVNQHVIPDVSGNETYHYGSLVDARPVADGVFQLSFSDGSTVRITQDFFDSVYDSESNNINLPGGKRVPIEMTGLSPEDFSYDRHQLMVDRWTIPDEDWNDTVHYGEITNVSDGPSGTYTFSFEDGTSVNAPADFFASVYDFDTGQSGIIPHDRVWVDDVADELGLNVRYEKPTDASMENSDVVYLPDLVMEDGSRIGIGDVERLLNDKTPDDDENEYGLSDDDISYTFSGLGGDPVTADNPFPIGTTMSNAWLGLLGKLPIFNLINNRPARLGGQEVFGEDGPDISNLPNNAIDWTAGSIPISAPGIFPWLYSASNAGRAITGANANSFNPATMSWSPSAGYFDERGNLRYGVRDSSGTYDDDLGSATAASNAAFSFLTPLTEMVVGPVGEQMIPLEKLSGKIPARSALGRLAIDQLVGAAGEGVEEILGNPFEEAMTYGPYMYADPVIDEKTGKPMIDSYGHELRKETKPGRRVSNFFEDVSDNANAFLGGAVVSGLMGLPFYPAMIGNARLQDRARKKNDMPLYIEPEYVDPDEIREDDREYASLFDR